MSFMAARVLLRGLRTSMANPQAASAVALVGSHNLGLQNSVPGEGGGPAGQAGRAGAKPAGTSSRSAAGVSCHCTLGLTLGRRMCLDVAFARQDNSSVSANLQMACVRSDRPVSVRAPAEECNTAVCSVLSPLHVTVHRQLILAVQLRLGALLRSAGGLSTLQGHYKGQWPVLHIKTVRRTFKVYLLQPFRRRSRFCR